MKDINQLDGSLTGLLVQMQNQAVWVALPCIVESYNPIEVTITAQPVNLIPVSRPDGTVESVKMPVLPDVPVVFTRGGGCLITHPVEQGDECLVVFASRSIDEWWLSGEIKQANDARKNDLSDGFAIFGPQSQAKKVSNISSEALQIRSDDGAVVLELNPQTHQVRVKGAGVTFDAPVTCNQGLTVKGGLTNNGKDVGSGHKHSNVKGGTDQSGEPV